MKKILIAQLGNFGDCLYATTILKQIKKDYKNSHITWAISSKYKSILDNNPYVDVIWEVPFEESISGNSWYLLKKEAESKKRKGIFDLLIFSQITPSNWHKYNGTIRGSILSSYEKPITVPVNPVLQLSNLEVDTVKDFVSKNNTILEAERIILFECTPTSGQSDFNTEKALEVSKKIIELFPNTCCIISSPGKIEACSNKIIDASTLSFRENAELFKYCTLFVGCSSGITWLSTSEWVDKKINTIQILNDDFVIYAGMIHEHQIWKIDTKHIIETTNTDARHILNIIKEVFNIGFDSAKNRHSMTIVPNYKHFVAGLNFIKNHGKRIQIPKYFLNYCNNNKHLSKKDLFLTLIYETYRPMYYILIKSNNFVNNLMVLLKIK